MPQSSPPPQGSPATGHADETRVPGLALDEATWEALWRQVGEALGRYRREVKAHAVAPPLDPEALRAQLAAFDFEQPLAPAHALAAAVEGLWTHAVHTPHPRYLGLFNPAPTDMGIAADALVAGFNPQLAAWSHSPFASEVERHLVHAFGRRFNLAPVDGVFTTGGAEANFTALQTAAVRHCPAWLEAGARAFPGTPTLYVSDQSHDSFRKAARQAGLGLAAVRVIPSDADLRMDVGVLLQTLEDDRARGCTPFLLVGTAGTTSAGVIDPLEALGAIAAREGLWYHVDAAWGGAAAFVPELQPALAGIERADSITFDAHKWLSVPMGAGMFLTRHPDILAQAFRVAASYMPREANALDVQDGFTHSVQWSRRFIGLKVFLSLAVAGWTGYADVIRRMVGLGDVLRAQLTALGWRIANDTPLPVVCAVPPEGGALVPALVQRVNAGGEAWVSVADLPHAGPVVRACITNYRTTQHDVHHVAHVLDAARKP